MNELIAGILIPVVGFLGMKVYEHGKELGELRPVKENLEHIRQRVDELYSHLIRDDE